MEISNRYLHKAGVKIESLRLNLDHDVMAQIGVEMARSPENRRPIEAWITAGSLRNNQKDATSLPIEDLMKAWVGYGSNPITIRDTFWYYSFLKSIDYLGITNHYFSSETSWRNGAEHLCVADLGSIMDVNIATTFLPLENKQRLRVVEVGGGYGRLAETFLNVFEGQVSYLLVDSVPASLWFAYEYLRKAVPNMRIGFYFNGDGPDFEKYDCYILPGWRLDIVEICGFDLAVNIQSMQEMDQQNVDFYLNWFDKVLKQDGITYLANRRDHMFVGAWNFPAHWECMLKICTPRSWQRDFPTEVYRKGQGNYETRNRMRNELYKQEADYVRHEKLRMAEKKGYVVY